jgi:hypothetical protein
VLLYRDRSIYNYKKEVIVYDLMATTGSRRDAMYAGMMPDKIPINTQMEIANERMPAEI